MALRARADDRLALLQQPLDAAPPRSAIGIPDSLHGWLFGQMLTWFGILYYGLTEDLRWYAAGLVIQLLSFLAFPIRKDAA